MAKSAGSLHCPNCGSPAAPGDAKCKYCQARLATVSCPSCFALMFGRLSGAVVDVCKGHGTFLDAGELHQIVSFIQGGGLERARQRQLEDLKDEEQKLRSLQQTATHTPTIDYVSAVDPMDGLDL